MRKRLTLTASLAAALSGCAQTKDDWSEDSYSAVETAVCVDRDKRVVDESQCQQDRFYGRPGGYSHYYMGRGMRLPFYGDSVTDARFAGGSFQPARGVQYYGPPVETRVTRSVARSRGGFGSSGRSFGGGRS
jgi:hypothetical protein